MIGENAQQAELPRHHVLDRLPLSQQVPFRRSGRSTFLSDPISIYTPQCGLRIFFCSGVTLPFPLRGKCLLYARLQQKSAADGTRAHHPPSPALSQSATQLSSLRLPCCSDGRGRTPLRLFNCYDSVRTRKKKLGEERLSLDSGRESRDNVCDCSPISSRKTVFFTASPLLKRLPFRSAQPLLHKINTIRLTQ